jgi:hypothetical protein
MRATLLSLISVFFLAGTAGAEQWQVLGTRPMGMGGAFVAVAQGPIAQYWNPAGLVKTTANVSGMEIPVGAMAEFTGKVAENASQIGELADQYSAIQTAQTNGTAINADQVAAFVKTLALMDDMNTPGTGVLVEAAGGVNFKFSKLALSVNNFTSVGLNPFVDTTNIGLGASGSLSGVTFDSIADETALTDGSYSSAASTIKSAIDTIGFSNLESLMCGAGGCTANSGSNTIDDSQELANVIVNQAIANSLTVDQVTQAANTMVQYASDVSAIIAAASSGNPYTNNQSALTVAGASFFEIAAGYAWNMDKWLSGLSLGGNVKAINGRTLSSTFRFLSEDDTADAIELDDPEESWAPGLDLGLLWNVSAKYPGVPFRPRLGIVGRNLNSPKFDTLSGADYTLDRQVRLGLALNPLNFWTLAADVDLTENDTAVSGFKSRQLALGTEINLINRKAFNIPLRAGIMKNLAESDSKLAYTLGTGLNLLYMHLDVSGVISSEKTEFDGEEYPTRAALAVSFGLLF